MDIPEFYAWSLARRLVQQFGGRAPYDARMRMSAARAQGDTSHAEFWEAVAQAADRLISSETAHSGSHVSAEQTAELE
jgi:hypothetical protein